MTAEITAHQLLPFLSKQADLPLRDASATPGGLLVILDDHDERLTWALIYYTDKRTEHCLSREPLEERGWAVDRSIKRDISPDLAERIIKAHLEEIIRALGRGLALRENVNRHHGIEDDWHCQLISRGDRQARGMARVGTIGSEMTHPRLARLRDCEGLPEVPCWLDAAGAGLHDFKGTTEDNIDLDIDPARFRFVTVSAYVRDVYYGGLRVFIQHFNDPDCRWEQERALDAAASLLRYRWSDMSAHDRLRLLAAIDSQSPPAGRD